MKKVLIVGMTKTAGGVESFLLNYYKNIDRSVLQFDFLCLTEEKIAYEQDLQSMGASVFHTVSKRQNPFLQQKQLVVFFKTHAKEYIALWANLNSLANINFLQIGKKCGIRRLIVHSHNTSNMGGKLQLILHEFNKMRIGRVATDYWACSKKAAEWFYNKKVLPNSIIIRNAIDIQQYKFSEEKRQKYRKMLKWENNIVIGNIGRLHFQKNQHFAIRVFKELYQKNNRYRLLLIGEGEDRQSLESQIQSMGLSDAVKLIGRQSDIQGWLSAMDIFLFPSVFEGLSIVALEAQANGLPIVASDQAVIDEGILTAKVMKLPLDWPIERWCDMLMENSNIHRISDSTIFSAFQKNGFDISMEAKKLENWFLTN